MKICKAAGCRLMIYGNIAARLPVPLAPVYATGWSIWPDLQIAIKTVWHLALPPKTAY